MGQKPQLAQFRAYFREGFALSPFPVRTIGEVYENPPAGAINSIVSTAPKYFLNNIAELVSMSESNFLERKWSVTSTVRFRLDG